MNERLSRRNFLINAAIIATAGLADATIAHIPGLSHIPGFKTVSRGFWEALESGTIGVSAEEYQKRLRGEFRVEILAPSTGITEVSYYGPDHKHKTIEWDSPRLKSLIDVLKSLPPRFYQPRTIDGKSYPLRFALIDAPIRDRIVSFSSEIYAAAYCDCYRLSNQLIVINKADFGQTFTEGRGTQEQWIHELTHAIVNPEIFTYLNKVIKPLGIGWQGLRFFFTSEFSSDLVPYLDWAAEVCPHLVDRLVFEKELGDRFTIFNENLAVRTDFYLMLGEYFFRTFIEKRKLQWEAEYGFRPQAEKENLWEIRLGTGDVFPIQPMTQMGYGVLSLEEFLATAAGKYSGGHNYFHRVYDPFLKSKRTEQLYQGVRESIFSGYEYIS